MKRGDLLSRCIKLMVDAHYGQFDRGGVPYCMHALAVMHILNSNDEELNCIAVLHDVIEDTKTTWQDLRNIGCTERVIEGVSCLTKMPGQTYDEYKNQVFSNLDAVNVKKADLTHNSDIRRLKGVSEKDIDRMAKYHSFYLELCVWGEN